VFPLAGFWSKDEILGSSLTLKPVVFGLLVFTAFLTAFYMTRQVLMVFFGPARSVAAEHAKESPALMTVPLIILAILSAIGGIINLPAWAFLGPLEEILTKWLEHTLEGGFISTFNLGVALIGSAAALLGIGLGYWLYWVRYQNMLKMPSAKRPEDPLVSFIGAVFTALKNKWWVDELYGLIIIRPYVAISGWLAETIDWRFWHDWFHDKVIVAAYNGLARILAVQIDLGIIDGIANGLATVTQGAAGWMRRIQTGYVRNYALAVFLGLVIIISYLALR
jgi:NADH-quinone oxidoreductase subunit L